MLINAHVPRTTAAMTALPRPLLARHPIKALYVTYVLTVLGLIKIPFWILKFSIPAFRQNPRWPFIRALAVAVLRRVSELIARTHLYYATRDPSRLIENTPKNIAHAVWVRPVERELIKGQMDRWMRDTGVIQVRIPGYWYGKGRDQPKIRAAPGEKVLYHVHGGGYACFSAHFSDDTTNSVRAILKACAPVGVQRAFGIEYRVANLTPFPGIFADCLAGYVYLVRDCGFDPKNVILMGDSAGGHMALALTRYLRDEKVFGMPGQLILLSPWVDLSMSHSGPGHSGITKQAVDYVAMTAPRHAIELVMRGMPADSIHSPYLSSISTQRVLEDDLFEGFPRALIFIGGCEPLLDEVRGLRLRYAGSAPAKNATDKVAHVEYHEFPDAIHDWMCFPWHQPEFDRTTKIVKEWVKKL